MYTIDYAYWIWGILVSAGELLIALVVIYIQGRKKRKAESTLMVDASHVSAGYKGVQVLRDVTFKLEENQCIALIGNNGCGKTTFVKCILHQLKYKGKIDCINDIAIVPQDDIEFKGLTVQ